MIFATMTLLATLTIAQVAQLDDYGKLDEYEDKILDMYLEKHPYCSEVELNAMEQNGYVMFYATCTEWFA